MFALDNITYIAFDDIYNRLQLRDAFIAYINVTKYQHRSKKNINFLLSFNEHFHQFLVYNMYVDQHFDLVSQSEFFK